MKINIYCGLTVENKCGKQVHPVTDVKAAISIVDKVKTYSPDTPTLRVYSNSPDFISAIKYLCIKEKVFCEFFHDGVSTGTDIEPIYAGFNVALDMINFEIRYNEDNQT